MNTYLNKQQSCCRDGEGRGMELVPCESPCPCGWQQDPHGYAPHPHPQHHPQLHHPQYHYGGSQALQSQALQSAGATLPRQRGRLTASRSDAGWRSPSRTIVRAKAGSCDLWTECDCHGWHDPYQVKPTGPD